MSRGMRRGMWECCGRWRRGESCNDNVIAVGYIWNEGELLWEPHLRSRALKELVLH